MKTREYAKVYLKMSILVLALCVIVVQLLNLIIQSPNNLEKARAIVLCNNHHGVFEVTRLGYINCNDGYAPNNRIIDGPDVYETLKVLNYRTIFGITFIDWKSLKVGEYEKN